MERSGRRRGRAFSAAFAWVLALVSTAVLAAPPERSTGDDPMPALGIECRFLSREEIAHLFNLDAGAGGILVEHVVEGSPAAPAGLMGGDLPFTFLGDTLTLGRDLILQLEAYQACSDDCLREAPHRLTRLSRLGVTFLHEGRVLRTVIDLAGERATAAAPAPPEPGKLEQRS